MDLKRIFMYGTGAFVLICFGLFYLLGRSFPLKPFSTQSMSFKQVESQLNVLENEFFRHKHSMKDLDNALDVNGILVKPDLPQQKKIEQENVGEEHHAENSELEDLMCSAAYNMEHMAQCDISMLDVFEELKFDNPDGGAWKQGWDIQIQRERFESPENKLNVFVIPHSHNDPGWIQTFERYYELQTRKILNSMLKKLSSDPEAKFIWAEISYFNLWWNDISLEEKKLVKKLVENKQLEFVTGGWVMPDEANSHFYSIILQLIEGHQWLYHHLNVIPRNGWSIDPFGMSPVNGYFLRRSGLNNMLIQRTHYSVKKYLALNQQLEFKWRQTWDSKGNTDILCHMMPFYSYDIPHTCGPDPEVCCQFDFKRMRRISHITCPWHVAPQPIINRNVRERSLTLLNQYKKKAMLYKTNNLLVPLGDDFRWEDPREWDAQITNYKSIMSFINNTPELNAKVQFATLDEYFSALNEEIQKGKFQPWTLSGDFFSYADKDDNYWTGYFTSRPFHKSMDRKLLDHLRSAQILFNIMAAELSRRRRSEFPFIRNLLVKIVTSRRNFSLFQHHDGITGTSKDHVMMDYAEKLVESLDKCSEVMQHSIHVLTHLEDSNFELQEKNFFEPITLQKHVYGIPSYNRIVFDRDLRRRMVTVFNPIGTRRTTLVTLHVSTYKLSVTDRYEKDVDYEIFPVLDGAVQISGNEFELNFLAELEPFEIKTYYISFDPSRKLGRPKIYVKNSGGLLQNMAPFSVEMLENTLLPIEISNDHMKVKFNENGFTESVTIDGETHRVNLQLVQYGARIDRETSGLYLFLPDGPATPVEVGEPVVFIVKGRLKSYVQVWLSNIRHSVQLHNYRGMEKHSMEIKNLVHIQGESNYEMAMRINTEIRSDDLLYTDLNGFQMLKRKRFEKIPLQGNYYPLPTSAFIEDKRNRLTVLLGQPLGGASLASGELEIMLDRRLMQDDNRGAGQGDTDNVLTPSVFRLMFETFSCKDENSEEKPPMLSLPAQVTLDFLTNSVKTFISSVIVEGIDNSENDYSPSRGTEAVDSDLPCDVRVLDMYMLPKYEIAMLDKSITTSKQTAILVHRVGFDTRLQSIPLANECSINAKKLGRFSMQNTFGEVYEPKIQQRTLNFIHEGKQLPSSESVLMRPMEIYGFVANFQDDRE